MMIYDTSVFCHTISHATKGVYAIHWGEAGWYSKFAQFKLKLRRNKTYRMLKRKKPIPTLDEVIASGL
jgi:hypothetical protein